MKPVEMAPAHPADPTERQPAERHPAAPAPARPRAVAARKQPVHPGVAALRQQLDPANLRWFVVSSPGRLIVLGLVLIALCLSAGSNAADTVGSRQQTLDALLAQTEPDANSAHRLYSALSIADAAASTAFIAGGLEPQGVRDRYSQAIGEAAGELVAQSTTGGDTALRTGIATGLPVYTGIIETARANNRNNYPVGAAYLSEASNQMQTELLPMAEELQSHRSAAVTNTQRNHVRPPWSSIAWLVIALVALIWVQTDVARRWHRVLNPGLLLASGAILILLAWTVIAGSISAASMIRGRDDGAVPASRLIESRIITQQARSAETLKLVRRDATGDYDRTYDSGILRLTELLNGYPKDAPAADDIAQARSALGRWQVAHQRMNDTLARGDYLGAATVATGPGAADAEAQVDALDRSLERAITETRNTLRSDISQAARVLDFLAPGATVLGFVAAGCVCVGIWPRLREYR